MGEVYQAVPSRIGQPCKHSHCLRCARIQIEPPRVQLTDAAITYLAQSSLPELHSLYLGIAFSTEEAKAVANANLPKLHTLHIEDDFKLPALQHLCRGKWPCLKGLVIGPCTDIKDKMVGCRCDYYPHTGFDPFAGCNWPLLEKLSASMWSHIQLFTPEGQCKWPKLKTLTASCIHGQPGSCHPHLKSLVLIGLPKPACIHDSLAMQLPALKEYKVSQGRLYWKSEPTCIKISDLVTKGNWPLLAHLSLRFQELGLQGLTLLQQAQWSQMYKLDLSWNGMDGAAICLLVACKWPHLRRLKLKYNEMHEDVSEALSHGKLPRLQTLDLGDNNIDDACVQHLVQGAWPELVHLDLNRNWLDLPAMTNLLKGDWTQLTSLCLGQNEFLSPHEVLGLCNDVTTMDMCAFSGLLQAWSCRDNIADLDPVDFNFNHGFAWLCLHDDSCGYVTDTDDSDSEE